MRKAAFGTIFMCALCVAIPARAQQAKAGGPTSGGPTNPKAQKTYEQATKFAQQGRDQEAFDAFKKADKQDDGKCLACQSEVVKYGMEFQDWKAATEAAQEEMSGAHGNSDLALAHYDLGQVFFEEGLSKNKPDFFTQAHEEFLKALQAYSNFPNAMFLDGRALAHLNQDDAARTDFQNFVKCSAAGNLDRQRAERYLGNIDLARERMAPRLR